MSAGRFQVKGDMMWHPFIHGAQFRILSETASRQRRIVAAGKTPFVWKGRE